MLENRASLKPGLKVLHVLKVYFCLRTISFMMIRPNQVMVWYYENLCKVRSKDDIYLLSAYLSPITIPKLDEDYLWKPYKVYEA